MGLLSTAIAQYPAVRQRLLDIQRSMGREGCVIEGRSTAVEIFPEADLKIWLTADEATRRQRKAEAESQSAAEAISLRDKIDAQRHLAPMVKARGAIEVDTTNISASQAADVIVRLSENLF